LTCVDSGKRNQNTKEKAKRSRTHSDSDEFQAALFTSISTKAPSDNCDSDWEDDSDFEKKRSNSKTKFSKALNIPPKRESNDSIEILSGESPSKRGRISDTCGCSTIFGQVQRPNAF